MYERRDSLIVAVNRAHRDDNCGGTVVKTEAGVAAVPIIIGTTFEPFKMV